MAKIAFDMIANVGVSETWIYLTDIMTTIKGDESRAKLRPVPRIIQSASFGPFNQDARREFLQTLYTNIKTPHSTPLYAYSAPLTQESSSGGSQVYFNPALVPVDDGGIILLVNPQTKIVRAHDVSAAQADGAILTGTLDEDVGPGWIACLGMTGMIDDSKIKWNQITGEATVQHFSWVEPSTQRPGTSASLTTLDDLPILERNILADVTDTHAFNYELVDFEVGIRKNYSQYEYSTITSEKSFLMQRLLDPSDMDYWRLFLDTVCGSWKSFLLSTQLQDIVSVAPLSQGATSITGEDDVDLLLNDFPVWQYFEVLYSDGTYSRHQITNAVGATITFTPALPSDPKVSSIRRISYLLKGRMGDTVKFSHGAINSVISFEFTTTVSG